MALSAPLRASPAAELGFRFSVFFRVSRTRISEFTLRTVSTAPPGPSGRAWQAMPILQFVWP